MKTRIRSLPLTKDGQSEPSSVVQEFIATNQASIVDLSVHKENKENLSRQQRRAKSFKRLSDDLLSVLSEANQSGNLEPHEIAAVLTLYVKETAHRAFSRQRFHPEVRAQKTKELLDFLCGMIRNTGNGKSQ